MFMRTYTFILQEVPNLPLLFFYKPLRPLLFYKYPTIVSLPTAHCTSLWVCNGLKEGGQPPPPYIFLVSFAVSLLDLPLCICYLQDRTTVSSPRPPGSTVPCRCIAARGYCPAFGRVALRANHNT